MGDYIRSLLRNTSSHDRPWQLSAALAVGVLCGLLPKFSLMFGLIGCVCCAAPIHLPLAALACLAVSLASTALEVTAGRLGLWSLTHPELMDTWLSLNALPWVPWLGLNNSVVHGSLLLGLASLIPVYTLTKPIANRLSLEPTRLRTTPVDADFQHELKPLVASADPSERITKPSETFVYCSEIHNLAIDKTATWPEADDELDVDEKTCQELENLLATCNGDDANHLSADEVVQRAAQMAHFVDDLLTSCQLESTASVPISLRNEESDRLSENVHRRSVPQLSNSTESARRLQLKQSSSVFENSLVKRHFDHSNGSNSQPVVTSRAAKRPMGEVHQAETLRYLLHHLKAIKDKV